MLDIDLHNMFRKRVSSSSLPFNSWAYNLCLNYLSSGRLCPGELALGATVGRPPLCHILEGTILLMMRLFQLVCK